MKNKVNVEEFKHKLIADVFNLAAFPEALRKQLFLGGLTMRTATTALNNPYGDDKVIEACGLFGMMNLSGRRFGVKDPVKAISNMHERSNGLGGGFAIYGLYPEHENDYAFHIMYLNMEAKEKTDRLIRENFDVLEAEEIPVNPESKRVETTLLWRYFVQPKKRAVKNQPHDEYVLKML
jgi:glutamate synthase domain-containing protein 1